MLLTECPQVPDLVALTSACGRPPGAEHGPARPSLVTFPCSAEVADAAGAGRGVAGGEQRWSWELSLPSWLFLCPI